MQFAELFLVGVGLSMDAFAVSVCKGLSLKNTKLSHSLIVGAYFGVFQAIMPILGFFLGGAFADHISAFDHWAVFIMLTVIGGKMIWEARQDEETDGCLNAKSMLLLAVTTSIDALAVGISFSFLSVDIWQASLTIGLTTLALSGIGVKIGSVFGTKFRSKAELAGGVILVLIGVKILLEHLGVINF